MAKMTAYIGCAAVMKLAVEVVNVFRLFTKSTCENVVKIAPRMTKKKRLSRDRGTAVVKRKGENSKAATRNW